MADDFTNQAVGQAIKDLEENLIQASRSYEDAQRSGDPVTAGDALRTYTSLKRDYDSLTGADRPQQHRGDAIPGSGRKPESRVTCGLASAAQSGAARRRARRRRPGCRP